MTPLCSRNGEFTGFIDSLFTATSATCVTGLIVKDTYTHWNAFGQGVILALIQVGGLGLVTFTAFFNRLIGRKPGVRNLVVAKESIVSENLSDTTQLLRLIIRFTFTIEGIGAVILCLSLVPRYGLHGIPMSIFLAVSAFCNAGFDITGFEGQYTSLTPYLNDPIILFTIMALIVCGGLGFIVWYNLLNFRKTGKLMLHTKIVIIMTALLILSGTLIFAIFEWNNPETLGSMNSIDKIMNSMFQSITLRTAGFNTIDFTQVNDITKMFSIVLMFIGAAPGSTGGGLKVTAFAVLIMTVVSVIKGEEDTYILGRYVSKINVYKALAVLFSMSLFVFVSTGVVYYTSKAYDLKLIDAAFESVSAIATVGVTSGATAIGNSFSHIALIISMFVGRVGPVSLALSLALRQNNKHKNQIVPEGKIIIG